MERHPVPGSTVEFDEDVLEDSLLEVAVSAGTACVVLRERVVRGRALGLEMRTPDGRTVLVDDGVLYELRPDGVFRGRGRFANLPLLARWSGAPG